MTQLRDKAVSESTVSGKYAIVTGGNTGIGLETCYFLLKAGYKVIIGKYLLNIIIFKIKKI